MGDHDKSLADFDQSIKLDPKNPLPYYNRGLAARDKGDLDRAVADFSQSIRMDARNALAFYHRGLSYWDRREFDKALADYEQAIRINPGYAPTYYNRGLAYFERRDYDRAINDLNQAINGRPNYPLAFNIRGLAYIAKGETDRGIQDFDQAIRLDAKFSDGHNNRGEAYRASATTTVRSPTSTRRSRRIRTTTGLNNRGSVYRDKRDYDHAAADFGQALKINPRARRPTTTAASRCGTKATTRKRSPTSSRPSSSIRSSRRPMPTAAQPITTGATTTAPSPTSTAIRLDPQRQPTRPRPCLSRQGRQRARHHDSIRRSSSIGEFSPAFRQPRARRQQRAGLQSRHRRSRQRDPLRRQFAAPTTFAAGSMRRPARPTVRSPTFPRRSGSSD